MEIFNLYIKYIRRYSLRILGDTIHAGKVIDNSDRDLAFNRLLKHSYTIMFLNFWVQTLMLALILIQMSTQYIISILGKHIPTKQIMFAFT